MEQALPGSYSDVYGGEFSGWWGNSAILLYNASTDAHPAVTSADGIANNLLYCSDFKLLPKWESDMGDGNINGYPDRNVWTPSKLAIEGTITQKMLARIDGSPDYVMARLYEHARHLWGGYASAGVV